MQSVMEKVEKHEKKGILIPAALLRKAGITGKIELIVRPHMIMIRPSYTQLTKGLLKDDKIDIAGLHRDYENNLFMRGLGEK